MTPPINPRTRQGKFKYLYDTILSLKEIAKSEKGKKKKELNRIIDLLSNFNNSL